MASKKFMPGGSHRQIGFRIIPVFDQDGFHSGFADRIAQVDDLIRDLPIPLPSVTAVAAVNPFVRKLLRSIVFPPEIDSFWVWFGFLVVVRLGYNVNHIYSCDQNQNTTDPLENHRAFGLFVPVHISLNQFCRGSSKDDNGAVSDSIGQQQGNSVR